MTEQKRTKRDLILDAAFDLFIKNGYENTKISEVAEKAGIGKGTVYEYFKSKDALFYEILKSKILNSYSEMQQNLHKIKSNEEKLRLLVINELNNAKAFGNLQNVIPNLFKEFNDSDNKDFISSMHQLLSIKFKILYEIINEGITSGEFKEIDPLMTTLSLMGTINFYVSFSGNLMPFMPELEKIKKGPWMDEEFFTLIFQGIKRE